MSVVNVPGVGQDLGRRILLTATLPSLVLVLGVGLQLAAGAPQHTPSRQRLVQTLTMLTATEWTLLIFAVLVTTLVLQPLQSALVRAMEGYPLLRGPLRVIGLPLRALWRFRWNRLNARQQSRQPDEADFRKMAAAAAALRSLPQDRDRLMPTRLGNTLRAAEDRPAERYGLDVVAAWPLLTAMASERATAATDDARDQLDSACRFSVSFTLLAGVSAVLLPGWWRAGVVAAAAVLAVLAYRAAVAAARTYGELVNAVVALHRFDLLSALHLELPADAESERRTFEAVSRHLRQGWPVEAGYRHPPE